MDESFTEQQVNGAISVGLRGIRPGSYTLPPQEAALKEATYRNNLDHYRSVAQQCLADGDYRQAAEKLWGAYAQTIKAACAGYGVNLTMHRSLVSVAQEFTALAGANPDVAGPDAVTRLQTGFVSARSLHQHFYENDLADAEVAREAEDVMAAIDLLQRLFYRDGRNDGAV